jgi:ADP-heptose:LPS heptosyltransferase
MHLHVCGRSQHEESCLQKVTPKFTISILAMDGIDVTRRCIESVLAHSENYELILTDNASVDGTAEYFESLKSTISVPVRVIHNGVNRGFSRPNNEALEMAKGEYFVTLNNDAEVPADWLSLLEQPFLEHDTAAISGPVGSCCSIEAEYPSFHGTPGRNYEYVEGSCLCIPVALAKKHGLFATYLKFAYSEDCDLSFRMRARGLTIHQVPFTIRHIRAFTSRVVEDMHDVHKFNHVAMIQRWGNYHLFKKFDLPFVIRRQGAVGDVLLTTPLIRAIKDQQPRGEIFVETQFPDLFINNPYVSRAGTAFPQVYKWANIIDLDMSYENQTETHIIQAYLNTARFMQPDWKTDLFPSERDILTTTALMGHKNWCAVHAGPTTWVGKNWMEDRWQEVCRWLSEHGWKVVLVGNPGMSLPHYLDLRGKTTFQSLAAVMRLCKLFVGVDSFPIHAAQSQGVPVVGLFGASSPEFILNDVSPHADVVGTAPCAGERHRIYSVTHTACQGDCMKSIEVDHVLQAISYLT